MNFRHLLQTKPHDSKEAASKNRKILCRIISKSPSSNKQSKIDIAEFCCSSIFMMIADQEEPSHIILYLYEGLWLFDVFCCCLTTLMLLIIDPVFEISATFPPIYYKLPQHKKGKVTLRKPKSKLVHPVFFSHLALLLKSIYLVAMEVKRSDPCISKMKL